MINIDDPQKCCGCTACMSVCNHNAITMQPDTLGFLYPVVNKSTCTECGLCEKVCAFHSNYDISKNLTSPLVYGARHKDIKEVETSRSGAAFIALSDWILKENGIVYGAGYTEHFKVVHKRATTAQERNEFKGSKYVQSDLTNTFHQVKKDLLSGKKVLFSGTPCQTAGLNSYIPDRLKENLYLIDIICHGVPSPYIWKEYLSYIEKEEGKPATSISFRNKIDFGWTAHKETFYFENNKITTTNFTKLFYKHIMFRKSCKVCPYTNLKRPSDITIGDFWGWEKSNREFNKDDKGCSLVFCNTTKGQEWFNLIKNDLTYFKTEIKDCMQPNLIAPSSFHPQRDKFEADFKKYGFSYVIKKYTRISYKARIKSLIKKIIKL